MKASKFDRLVSAARMGGLSIDAARLVLVDSIGLNEASRQIGVDKSIVSRTVKRINGLALCRACGQPLPKDRRPGHK